MLPCSVHLSSSSPPSCLSSWTSDSQWDSNWGLDTPFNIDEKEIINEKPVNDNYEEVVIVVAKNLNDLDKISDLYNLECVDINDDIITQFNKERKMYVFKK